MDPSMMIAAGGGAALAGGLMSYFSQMSALDRMQALSDQALQQFIGINIPDPKQQELALKQFVQQGTFTPELERAIQQQPSAFSKIVSDQADKAAQDRALQQMSDIGANGGLRLQDKAALQDAMMDEQVKDRGARNAILADSAARGQGGGSGMAMQAQLEGQQAAGDRAAKSALDVAGQAQDRALQSIEQSGQLASQYRTQDFNEQAQKAQAQDAINRFNTQNLQDVQHSNVGMENMAQQQNLAERQNIADKNTDLSNQQQEYNKSLIQQKFNNQMQLAGARANAIQGQEQVAGMQGQAGANLWSNIGQTGLGVGTSMANQSFWNDYFNKQKKAGATTGA